MELLDTAISKLDKDTAALKISDIQEILLVLKKSGNEINKNTERHNKILEKLWFHLTNELKEFDDQLLCSITFFVALNKSGCEDFFLKQILNIVQNELENQDISKSFKMSLTISFCYGLLQSSYIQEKCPILPFPDLFVSTLEAIFQLLIREAYKYTQYTFIVFKILSLLKKIYSTPLEAVLMTRKNKIKILNLVNHNWENPITGIRNLNKIIFRNLLLFLHDDKDVCKIIFDELNWFYWNKAKYLMLAEIIDQSDQNIENLIYANNWLDGLIYSLSKPGLVAAGSDMYNAILKAINSESVWINLFLNKLKDIFGRTCNKVIENFSNYWCLNTLKKFPSLSMKLIEEIYNLDESEQKLLIIINIIKQSNKLLILPDITENIKITCLNVTKDISNSVLSSLEHSNVTIRMLAFEIICLHQKKTFPLKKVYENILKYLYDNVNSDCTVLRISMINSLSLFLTKLLTLYLNCNQEKDSECIQNLGTFCHELQDFVIESLQLNGNYQRKITSIKITHTILKCLSEVPKKKREQIKKTNVFLIDFLKENGHWQIKSKGFTMTLIDLLKDTAKDVNEGVLQLLSEHYMSELMEKSIINYLTNEALKCIASKFFYDITCGQIILKLIINIIINNKNIECMFKSVEDIFNFAYNEIKLDYTSKRDIVESIEDGKQLHSFLSILSLLFESSLKHSYDLKISNDTICLLLDIVEYISNQFVWEEDISTSSDFSKMSEMVETIIERSGINQNVEDTTQISGLYQIVLNCLWLNVKASCELASLLLQYYKHDKTVSEKCLTIIVNVLETSRHKGAIEAAGATLGVAIQFLTSLPEGLEASKLPLNLLKKKLKDLLVETAKMSSVTRRGAGLSIMLHRMVSNDLQKGKPLFHYFIKTLLQTCKNLNDFCIGEGLKDNERDLPKAIYIHLLTRIVMDSSLASDTMYYSAELAELAFDNLSNNHWQIRNAALQLYGALIPKLIGQKKASGLEEETVATVACDEFRTHSPKLWKYIVKEIQNKDYKDIIQGHSNLVPILNVLASLAKRYNFSYDSMEQELHVSNLLPSLISLLASPIYTVRRLTAHCITNMYTFGKIYKHLSILNVHISENCLHGRLMLLSNCYKIYCKTEHIRLESLINKYQNICLQQETSYISKWSLEKLIQEPREVTIKNIQNVLLTINNNKHKPGVSLWANIKIKKCLEHMPWNLVPEVLVLLLKSKEFETYSEVIMKRINDHINPHKDSLVQIVKMLLTSDHITSNSDLWKIVYCISLKVDLDSQILNMDHFIPYIKHTTYKLRYMIPVLSRIVVKQKNYNHLLILSQIIFSLCNPDKNDVDMRHIAVLSNNEFGYQLRDFPDDIIINIIKSAVVLLQDEDDDIRHLSVEFYKNLEKETKHPFICLNKTLSRSFLNKIFKEPETSVQKMCNDLSNFADSITICKDNDYNPFSNDSKNIYLEVGLFRQMLSNICKSCLYNVNCLSTS